MASKAQSASAPLFLVVASITILLVNSALNPPPFSENCDLMEDVTFYDLSTIEQFQLTKLLDVQGNCYISGTRRDCRDYNLKDPCKGEWNYASESDIDNGMEIIGTFDVNTGMTYDIYVEPYTTIKDVIYACSDSAICARRVFRERCRSCPENSKLVLQVFDASPTASDLFELLDGTKPDVSPECRHAYNTRIWGTAELTADDAIQMSVRTNDDTSAVTYLTTCEECSGSVAQFDKCVECYDLDDGATFNNGDCECPAGKYPHYDCSDEVFDINWLIATSQSQSSSTSNDIGPNFNLGNGNLSPLEAQNVNISDYCDTLRVSGSLKPVCRGKGITHTVYGDIAQSTINYFCQPHLTSCIACPKGMYKSQVRHI